MQDIPFDESHMYFLLQPLRQLGIRRLLFQYKVNLKFEKNSSRAIQCNFT